MRCALCQQYRIRGRSNNRKVVTMSQMFILKWRFCCHCCRCCLSSLSPVSQLCGRREHLKTMKNLRAARMNETGKWWKGDRENTKTRQCLNKHTLFLCRVFFWSTYPYEKRKMYSIITQAREITATKANDYLRTRLSIFGYNTDITGAVKCIDL